MAVDVIEMTLSTAGTCICITARGTDPIPPLYSPGPGWLIVSGLATQSGRTTDECGLWAQRGGERR